MHPRKACFPAGMSKPFLCFVTTPFLTLSFVRVVSTSYRLLINIIDKSQRKITLSA